MPTIKQLIRNTRQPIKNVTKSPALWGCPQRRGTCTRVVSITFLFGVKCLEKNSGWEGHSSKSHWNFFLYTGRIRFVINRPG
ncbi:hypothetical protein AQUCO_03700331v1 [Aquilegia coerulea]|uniref:Ribosomal protein S12 n=1 Tax=Aquilegia coerulea TaxID=218851 RepID=A0A2G5CUW5_AQUCA|nr:hypothetical protein AQUCO_03700331v1 [Aquilegia coerulea]